MFNHGHSQAIGRSQDQVFADAIFRLGGLATRGGLRRSDFLGEMVEMLAEATGVEGVGASLHRADASRPAIAMGVYGPWTPSEHSAFLEQTRWAPRDRVIASRLSSKPGPRFYRTGELMPVERFRGSRLYNEFQRPRGIGDQATMCLSAPDGGHLLVAIARVGSDMPISDFSMSIAQRLGPFIEQCWHAAHGQLPEWVRKLSPRRRRTLEYVLDGLDDHQIARLMEVRYHTVRAHLKDLFRVAGVRSRLHLIQAVRGEYKAVSKEHAAGADDSEASLNPATAL